jgi:hypothetical protein
MIPDARARSTLSRIRHQPDTLTERRSPAGDPHQAITAGELALELRRRGGLAGPRLTAQQHRLGFPLRLGAGSQQVVGHNDLLEDLFQQCSTELVVGAPCDVTPSLRATA